MTRAYTSNGILVALSYTDSRTIYLHENMTTELGAWGPDDLTVANFRWAVFGHGWASALRELESERV